jgi:nitrate/nitrite transporter NarK
LRRWWAASPRRCRGLLADRIGTRWITALGACSVALGCFLLATLDENVTALSCRWRPRSSACSLGHAGASDMHALLGLPPASLVHGTRWVFIAAGWLR